MVAACRGGSGGRDATGFCGIKSQRSHGTSPTPLLPLVLTVADLSGGVVRQTQTACEGLAEAQLSRHFSSCHFKDTTSGTLAQIQGLTTFL